MKTTDLNHNVLAGGIFCVGQYLSGRAETVNIRNKTDGTRRPAGVVRETIITDTDPVIISRWLPDGEKAENWRPGFKKGDRVVVKVNSMTMTNGLPVLSGMLEALV